MKFRMLKITIIVLTILSSCSKDKSMSSLQTTVVEQKISSTDVTDNSFSVDIPLKTKKGEDFVIEEDGEFRLTSIDVTSGTPKQLKEASSVENEKPIFEIKNESGIYSLIPDDGLLIKKKVKDDIAYKLDVRLKKGALNKGETLSFSFSAKKMANSDVVILKKRVVLEVPVVAKSNSTTVPTTTPTIVSPTTTQTNTQTVNNVVKESKVANKVMSETTNNIG